MKSIIKPVYLLPGILILLSFLWGLLLREIPQSQTAVDNNRSAWQASESLPQTTAQPNKQSALLTQRWQNERLSKSSMTQAENIISYQLLAVIQQNEQWIALLKQKNHKKIYRVTQGDRLEADDVVQEITKSSVTLRQNHDGRIQTQFLSLYKTVDAP